MSDPIIKAIKYQREHGALPAETQALLVRVLASNARMLETVEEYKKALETRDMQIMAALGFEHLSPLAYRAKLKALRKQGARDAPDTN